MFRITIFITIFAFFLLRPYTFYGNIIYTDDDWSYFAHASSIAFGQFPFYNHEYWMIGNGLPAHPVGSGILAAPFVAFFSLFDRLAGSGIVDHRTMQNIIRSWSLFGFVFASGIYFWCGCAFLFYGLKEYFNKNIASWSVILLVLFEGAPLFAYRRPVYSHVYSFFVVSSLVYLLMHLIKRKKEMQLKHAFVAGLASGLTILCRFNDVFLGAAWPLVLVLFCTPGVSLRKRIFLLIVMYAVVGALILFFNVLPAHVNANVPMFMGERLLHFLSLKNYIKRIIYILFGIDWGLIFTAPFILIGLGGLFCIRTEMIKPFRILAVFLCINFWVIVQWMTQGGWYGYRYFIFTAFSLLIYPFASVLDYVVARWGKKVILPIVIISIFPVLSMLSFEGMTPYLSLHIVKQNFGVSGWGNNYYQIQIWRMIFHSPSKFLIAIFRGGPSYVLFLILNIFHKTSIMPLEIELSYLFIPWKVSVEYFIKSFLMYLTPVLLWSITVLANRYCSFSCIQKSGAGEDRA